MMNRKWFYMIVSCLGWFNLFAQDLAADYRHMSELMANASEMQMQTKVTVFEDSSDTRGELVGVAEMQRDKENYYSRFLSDEMIVQNNRTLVIDHENHAMIYFVHAKKKHENMAEVDIGELLKKNDTIIFKGMTNGLKHYQVITGNTYIIRTDLFLDTHLPYPVRIEYYYNQNLEDESLDAYKVVLDYSVQLKIKEQKHFRIAKYVSQTGEPKVTSGYKNYKLSVINDKE